jgi:hypothetical protein
MRVQQHQNPSPQPSPFVASAAASASAAVIDPAGLKEEEAKIIIKKLKIFQHFQKMLQHFAKC